MFSLIFFQLKRPVNIEKTRAKFAQLATNSPEAGSLCRTAGWGSLSPMRNIDVERGKFSSKILVRVRSPVTYT